jgi:hypothetical protein
MLLGDVKNIHTNHKNILHFGDSSQRRLRWISVVGRLDIVPYIRTFVQYDGTFGVSNQGQTLDV